MSNLEARIAEVITTHRAGATNAVQTCCMCDSTWRTHADHDAHAAAPLRQMIRDAKVEALREVASDLAGESPFHNASDTEAHWHIGGTWAAKVRARADNLEAPDAS